MRNRFNLVDLLDLLGLWTEERVAWALDGVLEGAAHERGRSGHRRRLLDDRIESGGVGPHRRAMATGRRTYGLNHVRSGWVEQNAPDWWTATSGAIAEAVSLVGGARIAAIAITHQRETFCCLGKDGEPIRPAITWMDVRATAEKSTSSTGEPNVAASPASRRTPRRPGASFAVAETA